MIPDIYRDLKDGAMVTALGYDIVIQRRSIGELDLPSGKLVACDPLVHPSTEHFEVELDPGTYPVKLVIAQLRDECPIAYAIIEVDESPARRWELATVPSEDTTPMSDEAHGYAVISSLGCFTDAVTATRLMEYTEMAMHDEDEIERLLRGDLRRHRKDGYSWANIHDPILGSGNLVVFTSGTGEGLYKTYVGYGEDGAITRVVTDFEVLQMRFPSFRF